LEEFGEESRSPDGGGAEGSATTLMLATLRSMSVVRGRVRGGHVAITGALAEGAEVRVVVHDTSDPFELDDAQFDELERRMIEADAGELEPVDAVLGRLRRRQP